MAIQSDARSGARLRASSRPGETTRVEHRLTLSARGPILEWHPTALLVIGDTTRAPKEKETMKLIIPLAIVAALGMSACEVNTPAGPAGPAGAPGAAGSKGSDGAAGVDGATGKAGKPASETIVVVPVPAK